MTKSTDINSPSPTHEGDQNENSRHKTPDDSMSKGSGCATEDESLAVEEEEYDDDDGVFADMGFMFEGNQPTRLERFKWPANDRFHGSIRVALHAADDDPGAVQSGHYLWPAAKDLSSFMVQEYYHMNDETISSDGNGDVSSSLSHEKQRYTHIRSILELGAGCALASLTALQLWQPSLQCVIATDHDPGTLERACDNYETTLEEIMSSDLSEDDLNTAINALASIPVLFEHLEWGNEEALLRMKSLLADHTTPPTDTFDLLLGTDLVYCAEVVEPLLRTVVGLLSLSGHFLLSQSFVYEAETEKEIDRVAKDLRLERTILKDEASGARRIQRFEWMRDNEM